MQEFQGKVISVPALPIFPDGEDKDNHGTPIAGLLLFGETIGKLTTKFKVRSYKAFEQKNNEKNTVQDLYSAIKSVIDSYNGKSRVYISSINYVNNSQQNQYETRKIDLLIQAKNICFVNSCGNINDAKKRLENGESRSNLWNSNKVLSPSDAPCVVSVGSNCKIKNYIDSAYRKYPSCFSRYGSPNISTKPEVLDYGGTLIVDGASTNSGVSVLGIDGKEEMYGTSFAAPLFARQLAFIFRSVKDDVKNSETIKAIAYSACSPTTEFEQFCGLGVLNAYDLSPNPKVARIILEGSFSNMNSIQIPLHELNIYIPVQPVEVTLIIVHSDNYRLQPNIDNYTAITIDGTKGQQRLQLRKRGNIRGWSHIRREVYYYKANSVGTWRFRLKPRLDKIPKMELPNLSIRYGGIVVIGSQKLPRGFSSLKSAIEYHMKKLAPASIVIKVESRS